MKAIADTIKDFRNKLTAATGGVINLISERRQQITDRKEQIDRIKRAPLPRPDRLDRVRALVEASGKSFLAHEAQLVLFGDRGFVSPWAARPSMPSDVKWWPFLCATDPERAVDLLIALAERANIEDGQALADRPALISQLEQELATIEAEEIAAVDAACAAGVTIEHRAEVLKARADALRKRELEEQELANRRARQQQLDQRFTPGPRGGRSSYIETGKLP